MPIVSYGPRAKMTPMVLEGFEKARLKQTTEKLEWEPNPENTLIA